MRRILLYSGKGGVGKSSIAILLSKALQERALRVGLLDCDFVPSLPSMLGLKAELEIKGDSIAPTSFEGLKFWSFGLMLPSDSSAITWRGEMRREMIRGLKAVEWGDLDYLVIDGPPGFSDDITSILREMGLFGTMIVTTPDPSALIAAQRATSVAKNYRVPLIGGVVNMADETNPDLGIPILAKIPHDKAILERRWSDAIHHLREAVPKIERFKAKGRGEGLKRRLFREVIKA